MGTTLTQHTSEIGCPATSRCRDRRRIETAEKFDVCFTRAELRNLLDHYASDSRYDGDFRIYFWIKGDEVQVAWSQDNNFICVVRK